MISFGNFSEVIREILLVCSWLFLSTLILYKLQHSQDLWEWEPLKDRLTSFKILLLLCLSIYWLVVSEVTCCFHKKWLRVVRIEWWGVKTEQQLDSGHCFTLTYSPGQTTKLLSALFSTKYASSLLVMNSVFVNFLILYNLFVVLKSILTTHWQLFMDVHSSKNLSYPKYTLPAEVFSSCFRSTTVNKYPFFKFM